MHFGIENNILSLYEKEFSESKIPTKGRPAQMKYELLEYCKNEIQSLLDKKTYSKKLLSLELHCFLCK